MAGRKSWFHLLKQNLPDDMKCFKSLKSNLSCHNSKKLKKQRHWDSIKPWANGEKWEQWRSFKGVVSLPKWLQECIDVLSQTPSRLMQDDVTKNERDWPKMASIGGKPPPKTLLSKNKTKAHLRAAKTHIGHPPRSFPWWTPPNGINKVYLSFLFRKFQFLRDQYNDWLTYIGIQMIFCAQIVTFKRFILWGPGRVSGIISSVWITAFVRIFIFAGGESAL